MSLFGTIGKIAGGLISDIIPGGSAVVSGINAVGSILGVGGSSSKPSSNPATNARLILSQINNASQVGRTTSGSMISAPTIPSSLLPQIDSIKVTTPTTIGGGAIYTGPGSATIYASNPQTPAPAGCAPSGYHWNRTGYYTAGGVYHAPRTKLVKNRRRNPLNPRALSHAMGRLTSAHRAAKVLDRIEVKPSRRRTCR